MPAMTGRTFRSAVDPDSYVEARDAVAEEMTPEQIAEVIPPHTVTFDSDPRVA